MTFGTDPGTGTSRAQSSGTRSKPMLRAATAGNSASRSSVRVKMQRDDVVGDEVVAAHDLAQQPLGRAQDGLGLVLIDGGRAAEGEQTHAGASSRTAGRPGARIRKCLAFLILPTECLLSLIRPDHAHEPARRSLHAGLRPPSAQAGRPRRGARGAAPRARARARRARRTAASSSLACVEIGKTVLLLEYDLRARERGWASTDVREVSPQADFRKTIAELAFGLLQSISREERMRARARRALGVVKAFSLGAPGLTARIDVEAATGTADSGDPEGDLAALLVEVGEIARAGGTGALFLVDEMHNLRPEALGAVAMAFHRLSQRALPVVLVGAGLPPLPRLLFQAEPYAERALRLPRARQAERRRRARRARGPAALRDVAFERHHSAAIEDSGGYPSFLQQYGRV